MAEPDRPGLVIFVIMTDGRENSSREFTNSQVKKMIEIQQTKYNWHFTFLGAGPDAFAEAGRLGIDAMGAVHFSKEKVFSAYDGAASKVRRMRKQAMAGETVENKFTAEEREEMK
jgi:hypothetical protein